MNVRKMLIEVRCDARDKCMTAEADLRHPRDRSQPIPCDKDVRISQNVALVNSPVSFTFLK